MLADRCKTRMPNFWRCPTCPSSSHFISSQHVSALCFNTNIPDHQGQHTEHVARATFTSIQPSPTTVSHDVSRLSALSCLLYSVPDGQAFTSAGGLPCWSSRRGRSFSAAGWAPGPDVHLNVSGPPRSQVVSLTESISEAKIRPFVALSHRVFLLCEV